MLGQSRTDLGQTGAQLRVLERVVARNEGHREAQQACQQQDRSAFKRNSAEQGKAEPLSELVGVDISALRLKRSARTTHTHARLSQPDHGKDGPTEEVEEIDGVLDDVLGQLRVNNANTMSQENE